MGIFAIKFQLALLQVFGQTIRLLLMPQCVCFPNTNVITCATHHLLRMSEAQSGAYSCTASLENGRRSFVQTTVRLKPDIILSQSQRIVAEENDDVFLECLLVPGVQAKRVWQFNGEYEYGRRSSYENQGGLLKIHQVLPSDSGNYTCLAHKKDTLEQDTIQYVLLVQPSIGLEPDVKACRVKDQSVANLKVFKTDNATIGIQWDLPDLFNKSCYEHIGNKMYRKLSLTKIIKMYFSSFNLVDKCYRK